MPRHYRITTLVGVLTVLLAACEGASEDAFNPISPSTLASLLTGDLRSATAGNPLPTAESCGNFSWSITEVSAGNYTGAFSATCANDVQLDGTATGTLVGDVLNLTATGTATPTNLPPCPFTMNGTARLVNGSIQIDYTGTTCLGPVSGTEILTPS